jgi:hypothetical protein
LVCALEIRRSIQARQRPFAAPKAIGLDVYLLSMLTKTSHSWVLLCSLNASTTHAINRGNFSSMAFAEMMSESHSGEHGQERTGEGRMLWFLKFDQTEFPWLRLKDV